MVPGVESWIFALMFIFSYIFLNIIFVRWNWKCLLTTYDDERKQIAIGHMRDSGALKIKVIYTYDFIQDPIYLMWSL